MIPREKRDSNDASGENVNVHHLKFKRRKRNRFKIRIPLSPPSLSSSSSHFSSSNPSSIQSNSRRTKKPRKCIKLVQTGGGQREIDKTMRPSSTHLVFWGGWTGAPKGGMMYVRRGMRTQSPPFYLLHHPTPLPFFISPPPSTHGLEVEEDIRYGPLLFHPFIRAITM